MPQNRDRHIDGFQRALDDVVALLTKLRNEDGLSFVRQRQIDEMIEKIHALTSADANPKNDSSLVFDVLEALYRLYKRLFP